MTAAPLPDVAAAPADEPAVRAEIARLRYEADEAQKLSDNAAFTAAVKRHRATILEANLQSRESRP